MDPNRPLIVHLATRLTDNLLNTRNSKLASSEFPFLFRLIRKRENFPRKKKEELV